MAEALRMLEDMSVESYLRKVEQGYGGSVLEDLLLELQGDLTFTKKLVLKEHHLYGSSRLGVKTHKRVLLHKEFSISGFSEGGEVVEDEIIDSLVYVTNENYFCRTLGLKQFEMTNHLGNVLATVLDRKTGVFDMGADTLMYYKADVVSATMYYPFGLAMQKYSNSEFSYKYKHQGQESDDEVYGEGNAYFYSYRMSDARYGRFWSVDPIGFVFPHNSSYAYSENSTIAFVEWEGLEKVYFVGTGKTVNISHKTSKEIEKIFNKNGMGYDETWFDKKAKGEYWTVQKHKNYWGHSSGTYIDKYASEKSYKGGNGEAYFHDANRTFVEWVVAKEESFEHNPTDGLLFGAAVISTIIPVGQIVSAPVNVGRLLVFTFTTAIAIDNLTNVGDSKTFLEDVATALGGEKAYIGIKVLKIGLGSKDFVKGTQEMVMNLSNGKTLKGSYDLLNNVFTTIQLAEDGQGISNSKNKKDESAD